MVVVGAGGMGANHARVLAGLKGVELVGIVDPDPQRAKAVAATNGCDWFQSHIELPEAVDAASVAVPSSLHAKVGGELLRSGIHCLIEKPLAVSDAESSELIRARDEGGVEVLVGHIERFNPAVTQLGTILSKDEPVALNARRMSAVSSRITDVDVVADLMVHDIDIVLSIFGSMPTRIQATALGGANGADHCTALLEFDGGRMASLTASRITQNKIRELEATSEDRFYTVDYSNQELQVFRQGRLGDTGEGSGSYVLDVGTERVFVRRQEPLAEELAHFVDVVRGKCTPMVSAEAGRDAMRIVWEIQDRIDVSVRHEQGVML